MKKILVLLVMLLMVGCEAKETVTPKEVKEIIKQEQQADKPKEEAEFTRLNFLIKKCKI